MSLLEFGLSVSDTILIKKQVGVNVARRTEFKRPADHSCCPDR